MRISDWSSDVCSSDLGDRAAIENDVGMGAHLVEVQQWYRVVFGMGAQYLQPRVEVFVRKRRCCYIDDEIRLLICQHIHRTSAVQLRRSDIPEVFANREGNLLALVADAAEGVGRLEIKVLIKHVVVGKQPLVYHLLYPACFDK